MTLRLLLVLCLLLVAAPAEALYRGDYAPGQILDFKFTTVTTTGAPTQLAGTPAVSCYKDNSVTQSTSGITLSVDFDSVTGLNNLRVDTSADGTFYATGSNFQCVITTGTVGGTSVVGYNVAEFSLTRTTADVRKWIGTAVATPTVAGVPEVDPTHWNGTAVTTPDTAGSPKVTVTQGTGTGQLDLTSGRPGIDWGKVSNPSSSVSLSATTVNAVTSVTGNVPANISNSGTAQAGGADTITLATSASTTADFYVAQTVHLTGGTGAGQTCTISTYSTGRVATCTTAWATAPDGTTTYTVIGTGPTSATVTGDVTVGGYAAGQDPATYILTTPANTLATDASGQVLVQPGTGTGQIDLSSGRVKDDKPAVGRLALKKGTTSYLGTVYIEDQRTGGPLTGLAFNTAGLTMYYTRADQGDAAATQCTLATATRGTFTSSGNNNCGFIVKDGTNTPGWYELSIANNIIATGSSWVAITLKGAANMKPATMFIELVDSNTGDIATLIGAPSVDLATDISTRLAPTVAGRTLDVTAGGTAGIDWANVEAPTTAVDLSGTTISTSQDVASVSGAVGSVTGNVGGNVVGSVASVTGNVGGNVGGNVTGSVGSVAAGGITDASFAADAITGDKIAADVATELASVAQGTFRKNVASQRRMPIFMRDASSVQAGLTGATVTVTVSKDGAAAGATTGSVAEISNGMYVFVPSQADTNCDSCFYRATAVGGVDFTWGIYTTP